LLILIYDTVCSRYSSRTFQTLAFAKSRLYLGHFWATGVNFINILRACFSYESKLNSFSLIMFGFVIFGGKILYKKLSRKMLMKLTTGGTRFCGFDHSWVVKWVKTANIKWKIQFYIKDILKYWFWYSRIKILMEPNTQE